MSKHNLNHLTKKDLSQKDFAEDVSISDSIQKMGLQPVFQMLGMYEETGVLRVYQSDDVVAEVEIISGKISAVHHGALVSHDAFFMLLDLKVGYFQFYKQEISFPNEMYEDIEFLLMEHARRIDEKQRMLQHEKTSRMAMTSCYKISSYAEKVVSGHTSATNHDILLVKLFLDYIKTYKIDNNEIENILKMWFDDRTANENLTAFLIRKEILCSEAEETIHMIFKGYLHFSNVEPILTNHGIASLQHK